jgi:hypothetical protein
LSGTATRRPAALLAALALGLLLPGCGGEDEEPVDGRGYAYSVPDGWDDATDEAEDNPELDLGGIRADTLVVGEREDGFTPNVNVVREPGLPDGIGAREYAEASLVALRDPAAAGFPAEIVETLERLEPRQLSPVTGTELAGEEARTWTYSANQEGRVMRIRQVASVKDGTGYTVTLTAASDRFEDEVGAFEEVVESWEWR